MMQAMVTLEDLLEKEWAEPDGFFFRLRQGDFDSSRADAITDSIKAMNLNQDAPLPRRLVSLSWFIPLFMTWQRDRVIEKTGESALIDSSIQRMTSALETLLGTP
jgi:hypothetical protein